MTLVIKGPYRPHQQFGPSIPKLPVIASDLTDPLLLFLDNRYGGGGSSITAFVHTQGAGASLWTINHNLGYRPQIQTYTTGGVEIFGDVLHVTDNQATVTFASSEAGFARCL